MTVTERLASVRERVASAAVAAGRDPATVRILAVSKKHGPEAIREAYAAGQRDFGENYVQELLAKAEALADLPELRWHFIGHLQRNKAKSLVAIHAAVQTVDSIKLAEALTKNADPARPIPVHLQVNVAREPQKSGCDPDELPALIAAVRAMPALRLEGLMTIPPASDDPEDARPHFRRLRELAAAHGVAGLSMGMSSDADVAIAEGATIVRIGTAIFGERI